ncbi:hypothetical protein L1987_54761 [Smallanthus sonchifolius]|uniref:Uncharacterized protein n=1 Tax=Smallanthus sonchifolius TaxID=185202 RepID=A0ACB9E7W4_9ASTR|nr:hypothetical protein L1987_54761 [Smallanthus sonchifolius]
MDYHQDSDPLLEVGEPTPNLKEPSDWVVELERFMDAPDEEGEEVPDDLLEMMAELDEIIGTTPSVGKLVEIVEDPDDPGRGLEVTAIENLIPKPLPILYSKGRTIDPTPSTSIPRSRPPRKRTRNMIDSSGLGRIQTPSVGIFKGDNLLGYLNSVIFGPGRFKLWWKDLIVTSDEVSMLDRDLSVMSLCTTGRPRRMKAVPVRIKEKPPDRLV